MKFMVAVCVMKTLTPHPCLPRRGDYVADPAGFKQQAGLSFAEVLRTKWRGERKNKDLGSLPLLLGDGDGG